MTDSERYEIIHARRVIYNAAGYCGFLADHEIAQIGIEHGGAAADAGEKILALLIPEKANNLEPCSVGDCNNYGTLEDLDGRMVCEGHIGEASIGYVTADGWQSEAESNGIDLCPSHATDIDDSFCPMCRMNVGESHDDAGCLVEAQAEGIAY